MAKERTKIEYKQTGDITGELYINETPIRVTEFKFKHTALNLPIAIIKIVDPDVAISTIDSCVVKKSFLNKIKSLFYYKDRG